MAKERRIFYRLGWEAAGGTMVNVWQCYSLKECIARRDYLLELDPAQWEYRALLISSHLDLPDSGNSLFGEGVYG